MNDTQLLVEALENEGVRYIFGIPGEESLAFLEALRTSKIRLVPTRHEQAAGFMAAIYGRLTGKSGVCLATLGPGAINFVTSVSHALLDGMPVHNWIKTDKKIKIRAVPDYRRGSHDGAPYKNDPTDCWGRQHPGPCPRSLSSGSP